MNDKQNERFNALEAKLKKGKAAKDALKNKDLNKLSKAELLVLVNELKGNPK